LKVGNILLKSELLLLILLDLSNGFVVVFLGLYQDMLKSA
jgi:hypothetical protein